MNRSASSNDSVENVSERPLRESETASKVVQSHSSNIDRTVMSKFALDRSVQALFLAPNLRVLRSIVVELWPKE